ncbi:hypothetical protein MGYG_06337 [Nannizzia gypsea CBS 118893]|uniref:Uncharacterized protein n=1 Tax=Arthroderma gypseum (strain ATCC MYA-4604 / CBS 118893) TaxID=535722 RepID=E4UZ11_ARTGP|nr:hypothetical protein MGYG_06337 [Nannizzia gypsea CBS 118893]EFR03341.1 hypothetical protein MGYG_06337 [Nannizzia gypsea CBS 118893]
MGGFIRTSLHFTPSYMGKLNQPLFVFIFAHGGQFTNLVTIGGRNCGNELGISDPTKSNCDFDLNVSDIASIVGSEVELTIISTPYASGGWAVTSTLDPGDLSTDVSIPLDIWTKSRPLSEDVALPTETTFQDLPEIDSIRVSWAELSPPYNTIWANERKEQTFYEVTLVISVANPRERNSAGARAFAASTSSSPIKMKAFAQVNTEASTLNIAYPFKLCFYGGR